MAAKPSRSPSAPIMVTLLSTGSARGKVSDVGRAGAASMPLSPKPARWWMIRNWTLPLQP